MTVEEYKQRARSVASKIGLCCARVSSRAGKPSGEAERRPSPTPDEEVPICLQKTDSFVLIRRSAFKHVRIVAVFADLLSSLFVVCACQSSSNNRFGVFVIKEFEENKNSSRVAQSSFGVYSMQAAANSVRHTPRSIRRCVPSTDINIHLVSLSVCSFSHVFSPCVCLSAFIFSLCL